MKYFTTTSNAARRVVDCVIVGVFERGKLGIGASDIDAASRGHLQALAKSGDVKGDPAKGAPVFQTTCASCHGFDGRALNWGDDKEPGFVGTEANANPWEVLHKIRNGHPGVEMISLRAFDIQTSVDLLAYTKTLPEK